ncbi:unnamed protein product [Closterium sp. NIES-54]
MVTTTTPGGQRVSICTCIRTGRHLANMARRPGWSLYTLATEPPRVAASAQVSASGQVAPPCSCRLLLHQTLLLHHRLDHPSLSLVFPGLCLPSRPCLPCPAFLASRGGSAPLLTPPCFPRRLLPYTLSTWSFRLQLRERFHQDLPFLRLPSDLLRDFFMEVARTSMIHAATPHFLWPFAVWYATHQLNLWPCISLPETSPTLRWTGEVGDASVFRDVMFDESIPFYRFFPYHSAPPQPPPVFLAPGPPPVDPSEGAAFGGAEPRGVEPGGAESEGAGSGGPEPGAAGAGDPAARDPGPGGAGVTAGAGGTGGAATAGPRGARTRGTGAAGTGGVGDAGAGDPTELGAAESRGAGVGGTGAGGKEMEEQELLTLELEVLELGVLVVLSQAPLQPGPPLPAPSPYSEQTGGHTERREPASCHASPVCNGHHVPCPRPPLVLGTHAMALRPSSVPLHVPLPPRPESSLPAIPDPESDRARAANPAVSHLLAIVVTDPTFDSTAASALVADLVDFAAACRLDYATALVAESESASPPSVGGECALGTDDLGDRQEDFECLAAAVPGFASTLLAFEGDQDAPDIPTTRSYAEAITGTYIDAVSPSWANIVDGMWIFRVKRPPGSPPAFKARYVARGFSQRQGVDYFQNFSPTPKMTTLWVLLHVAAQHDYELHSLDFGTAFLQVSLHEEIWLRRPPGFSGSFLAGTQWSLRRPVYGLRQAPREWHDTLRTTLAALGFTPSIADPSLFLRTDTSLPPF